MLQNVRTTMQDVHAMGSIDIELLLNLILHRNAFFYQWLGLTSQYSFIHHGRSRQYQQIARDILLLCSDISLDRDYIAWVDFA